MGLKQTNFGQLVNWAGGRNIVLGSAPKNYDELKTENLKSANVTAAPAKRNLNCSKNNIVTRKRFLYLQID